MNIYTVRQLQERGAPIRVSVPASKSVTNRALLLAALSKGNVLLKGGALSADTRAFLACLLDLGICVEQTECGLLVHGCGGDIPNKRAKLNVQSAGTAARFLTVALACCGGEYTLSASTQMEKRPMQELICLLRERGVRITCLKEEGHFPFILTSSGLQGGEFTVNTDKSSQYASAILLTAGCLSSPTKLKLLGSRQKGSYIGITLKMLEDFHVPYQRSDNEITVFPAICAPTEYAIEPDLSGACYFYALALLLKRKILVYGVKEDCMQGDKKFLSLLADRGVSFTQTEEGLWADGSNVCAYRGFDEDMQDYSDQTLTVAALAPFATTPSHLKNVAHIRLQECDRIRAIAQNLTALGVPVEELSDGVKITPAAVKSGQIEPFDDHRVAMAFALIGLKTGNIAIKNPDCCQKTFENYFQLIDQLQ